MTDSTATPGPRRPSDRELAARALMRPQMDDNTRETLWRLTDKLVTDLDALRAILDRFGPR